MMGRQSIKMVALSVTALGLVASTAWAQQELRHETSAGYRLSGTQRWMPQAQQYCQSQQSGQKRALSRVSESSLPSTASLVNLPVHDLEGHQVGSVRYLMLDTQNGEVLYALSLQAGRWISLIPARRATLSRRAVEPGPYVKKSASELRHAPPLSRHQPAGLPQPGWHRCREQ